MPSFFGLGSGSSTAPSPAIASPGSDTLGIDDRVRLELGGQEILIAESWDIAESVLAQPAVWTIQLGWGDIAANLLKKFPPKTPFKLFVGDALQLSGRIDARGASQAPGSATEITFRGRDALAPLHDSYVAAELSFKDSTYTDLVRRAVDAVWVTGNAPDIITSNTANRRVKSGVPIAEIAPPRAVDEIIQEAAGTFVGVVHQELQARVNESWHSFVRRHLDRAGLFIWSTADGSLVVSAPNAAQPPTYQIVRRTGEPNAGANVLGVQFHDDVTHRHHEYVIYGRGGGRKHGRQKSKGDTVDDEMVNYAKAVGAPLSQPIVYRDVQVQSETEALFFARRKMAEERRGGWSLEYMVSGHTLPYVGGQGGVGSQAGARAVIVPDTVVDVHDEELGIFGSFYIETVRRRRGPATTTTIRLMRIPDLLFGGES